ncbi:MAG: hypothetical protein KIT33_06280 [Candidatus Kapabacteria bacterium]|nr:hypothetical protein [Ignavibacteriota bacterium]MCW5884564.1 hypothetical protein [Candidatus Kapabacteria bacterium]
MLESIRRIWHPERYHGSKKRDNFFEGWYYKNVSIDGSSILSIIPGIFKSKDKSKEHAFIQFIDGQTLETHYIKFNVSEFKFDINEFNIRIGNCHFSENRVFIDIEREDFRAFGELNFKGLRKWISTRFSPGVMGWYSFVPFMECNHGIVSLNHRSRGKILINKNIYLFTFGRGYIEKDWGKSFPSSYIWMQSNSFEIENVSFFSSIARIPWFGSHFRGFICGLMVDDHLYKFATYTGAKISNIKVSENHIQYEIKDRSLILKINAKKNEGGKLLAPYNNQMLEGRVHETLLSEIDVELLQVSKKGIREIFKGKGMFAGLEVVGNMAEII